MHFLTIILSTEEIIANPLHVYNCLWQVEVCAGGGGGGRGQCFIFHHGGGLKSRKLESTGESEKYAKFVKKSSTPPPLRLINNNPSLSWPENRLNMFSHDEVHSKCLILQVK